MKLLPKNIISAVFISTTVLLSACNEADSKVEVVEAVPAVVAAPAEVSVDTHSADEKPFMSSRIIAVTVSEVIAIDHETRVVTLKGEDGESITLTVGEDARNLDQVNVGDIVIAEYIKDLTIEVMTVENAQTAAAEVSAGIRSDLGEMPAAATITTQVEVSTVEEINIEANTFKLKDASGAITEYVARDPENLKKAAVGDVVIATLSEAMAISVTKQEAADKPSAE